MLSAKHIFLTIVLFLLSAPLIYAGPPYDTDDPEPVDFRHWEYYCSSIGFMTAQTTTGTLPHIEINYGALPNVQLHIIAPLSFYTVNNEGKTNYGYGATELGVKFRFANKDSGRFEIGTFPLVEVPTGNAQENLGNAQTQVYLPLWVQKTIGKWTTYGGGGYWINPGQGNKNYEFIGWQAQYQFVKSASIGAELYDITATQTTGSNDLRFRLGSIIDFSEKDHLLLSIGKSLAGNTTLLWYIGYQLTI